MFKKMVAAIAVLGAFYSVVAQNVEGVNARIDAMGGCGVIGDIGWTVNKPCKIYGYADQVQASGIIKDIEGLAQTYGQIIAIKSIGEHFFVGLTINDRRAMSGTYYKVAMEQFGFIENFQTMEKGRWLPNWPHVNFNIKPNDKFSLGIGGYWELSKHDEKKELEFKYDYDSSGTPASYTMEYDSTRIKKYSGIGIIADAMIWFGDGNAKLNPEFRMFIPKLDGKVETNRGEKFNNAHKDKVIQSMSIVDINDHSNSTDLSDNLFLRVGTKLSGTIGETFWIGGFWYKTERFDFLRDTTLDTLHLANNTTPVENQYTSEFKFNYNKTCFDLWLGCQPSFSDKLILCPEYSGGLYFYDRTYPPTANRDTTVVVIKHKFRLGAEGSIKNLWIFQEFLPRFGITYLAAREITNYKIYDEATGTVIDDETNWAYSTNYDKDLPYDSGKGAKITAGFGLRGRRATFDVSLNVLEWKETGITGPGAALVSFTLNFAKDIEE